MRKGETLAARDRLLWAKRHTMESPEAGDNDGLNSSTDYSKYGITDVPKYTVTTALGKVISKHDCVHTVTQSQRVQLTYIIILSLSACVCDRQ